VSNRVRILEATVRDGGYMVDHHFSQIDLTTLVGGLDRAGLPYIEVGHGNGVGCHLFKDPKLRTTSLPLIDDAGHADIALRVAQRARVGVVLTAGKRFAPIEYIDRIADLGFAFVRVCAMPDEVDDELFAYVRRAKDRGLLTSINMMQTYAKTPAQVAELAARAADHGTDWWYIVDSAGGMMVDDVKRYVEAILGAANVEVGLHAHNNLGCAVANAIAAVEAGATLVDGTLNGIGRATGNAATEQLAVALRDRLAHDVDLDALVVLGNAVRSMFEDAGNESFDFISGGALVHSRNVPKVLEAARQRDRARCSFLLAVGGEARKRGVLNAITYNDELYDAAMQAAVSAQRFEPTDVMIDATSAHVLERWEGGPKRAIEELHLRSRQRHVQSVVHVSKALSNRVVPWQSSVMGLSLPCSDSGWDIEPSRLPDFVLVDEGDPEPPIRGTLATWRFSFEAVRARALQEMSLAIEQTGAKPVLLAADAARDAELGAGTVAIATTSPDRARVAALRARGIRVVEPNWPSAVAQTAESLIALHRELSHADDGEPLVTGIQACGPGQAKWDPERALLIDADEPTGAARLRGMPAPPT
jgi:4-hydroxy 2-oxovalerate aldolase